jgi:peptidoglycan-N-acetylglucosamine deacetylase
MKCNVYIILGLSCFFLTSCLAKSMNNMNNMDNPVQVVKKFYDAVNNQDCNNAKKLSPKYSVQSCRKIDTVAISTIELIEEKSNIATVLLDIRYRKEDIDKHFDGYVTLNRDGKSWIIDHNSYTSRQRLWPYPNAVDTFVETQPISNMNFSSDFILKRCWDKVQLRGTKTDKQVIRPAPNTNRQPPLKTEPRYRLPSLFKDKPELLNSIRYVKTDEKIVALTFDLCERNLERTGYDAEIVNYLRDNEIKATFYAGGKWMRSHPEKTMQLMADPLFEIGNHAWTHGNMAVLKGQKMREQIVWTQAQYELLRDELQKRNCVVPSEFEKIPPVPLTFRFPYGRCNRASLNALAEYGLPAIQWNVVTADPWSKQTVKGIVNAVSQIKPGSIIIAHANGRGHKTAQALPKVVKKIRAQGYKFVTITELLNSPNSKVVTKKTCYELKPGDNNRYDRIFKEGTE